MWTSSKENMNRPEILIEKPLESLPTSYQAHFVPCKVRYSGTTQEFKDQFQLDQEEMQGTRAGKDEYVTYIRGRKIVGKEITALEGCLATLVEETTDPDGNTTWQPVASLSKLVNYEREGNEGRLEEEMGKFQEFVELADLIHG